MDTYNIIYVPEIQEHHPKIRIVQFQSLYILKSTPYYTPRSFPPMVVLLLVVTSLEMVHNYFPPAAAAHHSATTPLCSTFSSSSRFRCLRFGFLDSVCHHDAVLVIHIPGCIHSWAPTGHFCHWPSRRFLEEQCDWSLSWRRTLLLHRGTHPVTTKMVAQLG